MNTFKTGQVVQLKSGGPPMTVERTAEFFQQGEHVMCVWFNVNNEKKNDWFSVDQVELVPGQDI